MDMVPLQASARDLKVSPKLLRKSKQVPCVLYGNTLQMSVQCPAQELHNAFVKAGESTLVELDVGGKKIPVLFKHVDFDPVSDREIHADFYAVDMKAEIETLVPVKFEGEAPAIKALGGVFLIVHDHVKVRCLPGDLPHSIIVSVLPLEAFHASVSVKDLKIPSGVNVLDSVDTVLATVHEPRAVEEIVVAAPVAAEGEAAAAVPGAPASAEAAAGKEGAVPASADATAGKPGAPAAEAQSKEKAEKGKAEKKK